jgi:hypothetical protein
MAAIRAVRNVREQLFPLTKQLQFSLRPLIQFMLRPRMDQLHPLTVQFQFTCNPTPAACSTPIAVTVFSLLAIPT